MSFNYKFKSTQDVVELIDSKGYGTEYREVKYHDQNTWFDVESFAKKIGLNIIYSDFSNLEAKAEREGKNIKAEHISGVLYENSIWINENHLPSRQRFTIGHEIGRFLTRDPLDDQDMASVTYNVQFRSYKNYTPEEREVEIEMDSFSAILLMDEDRIKERVSRLKGIKEMFPYTDSLTFLTGVFQVSRAAMLWRLDTLKLLDKIK